jgi:hypothetical protein
VGLSVGMAVGCSVGGGVGSEDGANEGSKLAFRRLNSKNRKTKRTEKNKRYNQGFEDASIILAACYDVRVLLNCMYITIFIDISKNATVLRLYNLT